MTSTRSQPLKRLGSPVDTRECDRRVRRKTLIVSSTPFAMTDNSVKNSANISSESESE